jgi:hypothetical protein
MLAAVLVGFLLVGSLLSGREVRGAAQGPAGVTDLSLGLMAHFPFDGNADDASGNGNHGTVEGPVPAPDRFGEVDRAYSFDGENDYIRVPDSDTLDLTTSATFALWVNVDPEIDYGVSGSPHLFAKGATLGALWADYGFRVQETRSVFEVTIDGNTPRTTALPAVPEGRWVHLAIVYHDSTVTLYENGIQVSQPITTHADMRVSDQPLYIGMRYTDNNAGRFRGEIDDLRVYDRALSDGEIEALAGMVAHYPFDGNAEDTTAYDNHGTVAGATLVADRHGRTDAAYGFDGVDDYIVVDDADSLDLTTHATFAMCVYVDPAINYGVTDRPHLLSKGATYGALWADYAVKVGAGASYLEMSDDADVRSQASFPAVPEGAWVHLAVVYEKGTAVLYRDGITATAPITTLGSIIRTSDQPLYIAHRYAYKHNGRFEGAIDNLRIYDRAMTGEEIRALVLTDCDRRVYLPLVIK